MPALPAVTPYRMPQATQTQRVEAVRVVFILQEIRACLQVPLRCTLLQILGAVVVQADITAQETLV